MRVYRYPYQYEPRLILGPAVFAVRTKVRNARITVGVCGPIPIQGLVRSTVRTLRPNWLGAHGIPIRSKVTCVVTPETPCLLGIHALVRNSDTDTCSQQCSHGSLRTPGCEHYSDLARSHYERTCIGIDDKGVARG